MVGVRGGIVVDALPRCSCEPRWWLIERLRKISAERGAFVEFVVLEAPFEIRTCFFVSRWCKTHHQNSTCADSKSATCAAVSGTSLGQDEGLSPHVGPKSHGPKKPCLVQNVCLVLNLECLLHPELLRIFTLERPARTKYVPYVNGRPSASRRNGSSTRPEYI